MKKQLFQIIFVLAFGLFQVATVFSQKQEFAIRGFHLDLRSEVMTMPALKAFAKELADLKINILVMEWEATFPYEQNATLTNKYAYKPQEIKDIIQYCANLGKDNDIALFEVLGAADHVKQFCAVVYTAE